MGNYFPSFRDKEEETKIKTVVLPFDNEKLTMLAG